MECPSCGTNLDNSSGENYVKCEYCRAVIAIMHPIDKLVSIASSTNIPEEKKGQLERLLYVANIDLENKDYKNALGNYERIISIEPFLWEAIVNQAICAFWLGREDMEHIQQVNALLKKADKLSNNNPVVNSARSDIAHNLAVIGSKKERYGDNIAWTIRCFEISKTIMEKSVTRDKIIEDYSISCYHEIFERLMRVLSRDRKDFDPPYSDLKTLWAMSLLTDGNNKEILESAIVFTDFKHSKYKNKTELALYLDKLTPLFRDRYPNDSIPKIYIPSRGDPRIGDYK